MHGDRVLPALFLAVVHVIEGQALAIELMVLDGRGDASGHREGVRVLQRQPQRSLAAHADAEQRQGGRLQPPAPGEGRDDLFQQMLFRGDLGIEDGTETIGPPRMRGNGTNAGHVKLVEKAREGVLTAQGASVVGMEK